MAIESPDRSVLQSNKMSLLVYKILPAATWYSAESVGEFAGAGIDLEDGFIHLSNATQVQKTADLYFADQSDLMLVAFRTEPLGALLRWESPRGDATTEERKQQAFPHYYGKLSTKHVAWTRRIEQDASGRNVVDLTGEEDA